MKYLYPGTLEDIEKCEGEIIDGEWWMSPGTYNNRYKRIISLVLYIYQDLHISP